MQRLCKGKIHRLHAAGTSLLAYRQALLALIELAPLPRRWLKWPALIVAAACWAVVLKGDRYYRCLFLNFMNRMGDRYVRQDFQMFLAGIKLY